MTTEITKIQTIIARELQTLERLIISNNQSDTKFPNQVCGHLLLSNGKRIRPMLVILSALASGYTGNENLHLNLACIIEFMHTATLLHDDVIDKSTQRRHQPTVNKIWGNTASILSGDLLYAKAFKLIAELQMPGLLAVLSKATEQIVTGELEHLQCLRKITTSKLTYLNIISAKTAKLFSVATCLGAMLSDSTIYVDALEEYGHHLGIIFQIMDDILDINGPKNLGKPSGQDVLEGKPTLPLILAYTHSNPDDQLLMKKHFINPETTLKDLMPFIKASNALELARQEAHAASLLAENCLNILPDTSYKQALYDLLHFALQRDH